MEAADPALERHGSGGSGMGATMLKHGRLGTGAVDPAQGHLDPASGGGTHANPVGSDSACSDGIGGLVDGLNGPHRRSLDFFVFLLINLGGHINRLGSL
jgi:hypothetical protein